MHIVKYELVIGLELHVQLSTKSKLFCGDSVNSDHEPNTHISVISVSHPGTLPSTNRKAVEFAITMGLACNCEIEKHNYFARKSYFYPDLPKGYQVSQHATPICKGGSVAINMNGETKFIQLNRIHLEEDAGKSIHDADDTYTCIDHNRAGTALIEIVTEPCIHSAEEACEYVAAIRKLVRWLGVSDGNMERGNLRCDANISLRKTGDTILGTKVEVKNLNSIRNLKKAIEYEANRMEKLLQDGKPIMQQTRSFDASTDTTFSLRNKEDANDYRYFPDPDLAPFVLTKEYIDNIRNEMPELPSVLADRLQTSFCLSRYDSLQLTEDRYIADFFFKVIEYTSNYKAIANWINGPIKKIVNEKQQDFGDLPLDPSSLAELIIVVEDGVVNFSTASARLLPAMLQSGKGAKQLIEEMNLQQVNNTDELLFWVESAINKMPDKVAEYKKGKKGLIGLFIGEVKKLSKGKADPKLVNELLEQKLNN